MMYVDIGLAHANGKRRNKKSHSFWRISDLTLLISSLSADPDGPGLCAMLITLFAALLLVATLPFSLCTCIKVSFNFQLIKSKSHIRYITDLSSLFLPSV
jgi:hypothetical protein